MPYHAFKDDEGNESGSFEVFFMTDSEIRNSWDWSRLEGLEGQNLTGWWWWACFPGCLPDGEPFGPFETEDEAIEDANS